MAAAAPGDEAGGQATREIPRVEPEAAGAVAPEPPPDAFAERPEVFVGAAFVGGLVAAQLLKRVRR